MRVPRPTSLLAVALSAATLTACRGDDDGGGGDGQRLTRAEYDLLVRHHREAADIAKKPDSGSEQEVQVVVRAAERQCAELERSGPVLRATAPSCETAAGALRSMVTFATRTEECPEDDDGSCVTDALEGLVGTFGDLVDAVDQSEQALESAQLGDSCREALTGSDDELRSASVAVRDAGREMLDAQKDLAAAEDGDLEAGTKRLEEASKAFEAAGTAFAELDDGVEESDPKPCEADVKDA